MAKFILPRLKRFKEVNIGCPGDFTEESWNEIIDKMIFAMQLLADGHWNYDCDNADKEKADWDKVQEGLHLFGKYFQHLWW